MADLLDQGLSQEDRRKLREKKYAQHILRRVSVESKEQMLSGLKKGMNTKGGAFGGRSPDREQSPNCTTSGFLKGV